jgi:hypothetical protein
LFLSNVVGKVLLRTVDNFQGMFQSVLQMLVLTVLIGEEADIVLLSLVRNPGEGKSGTIGFLKVRTSLDDILTLGHC